jgi:hypothetical protein
MADAAILHQLDHRRFESIESTVSRFDAVVCDVIRPETTKTAHNSIRQPG